MEQEAIGFIGLGNMGAQMARNLLEAGFKVTVYNRTRERAEALAASGAVIAASPQAAVVPGGIVVTMLANDLALQSVALGADGFLDALGKEGLREVSGETVLDEYGLTGDFTQARTGACPARQPFSRCASIRAARGGRSKETVDLPIGNGGRQAAGQAGIGSAGPGHP
jgi:NAD(P)-dependent dehydrogenase (short-subunit alcohol dehydrogenase family)